MKSGEFYLSYDETYLRAGARNSSSKCCECLMALKGFYWKLTCTDNGEQHHYPTCEACRAQRMEFCTEFFTPGHLMADLETLRSALSYDSARPWAMLTNAVSLLRQRRQGAKVPPVPTYTPTPLRGLRVVSGGFLPNAGA